MLSIIKISMTASNAVEGHDSAQIGWNGGTILHFVVAYSHDGTFTVRHHSSGTHIAGTPLKHT
jgi:hypothetical protein